MSAPKQKDCWREQNTEPWLEYTLRPVALVGVTWWLLPRNPCVDSCGHLASSADETAGFLPRNLSIDSHDRLLDRRGGPMSHTPSLHYPACGEACAVYCCAATASVALMAASWEPAR